MYSVGVRDHFMIAHSFRGETFGPAQNLHGATYVVDVEFRRSSLDNDNVVTDIGAATGLLKEVLADFNYKNLDDLDDFKGINTTTEFMARTIFDRLSHRVAGGALGDSGKGLRAIKVTLNESHAAWASFEGGINAGKDAHQ
ncbi:6-carboxytetrahydropterin synthase [Fodinicurvata sp. EGI_FJ10296]|uniref:6-pyruvoyl trahydropterin synthase family protein n=1 Tax=Fodinicurvata sp. EGI_FJ10296 TaxID=3231908 RepID=UPI003452ABD3